jgi:hypothetical protein
VTDDAGVEKVEIRPSQPGAHEDLLRQEQAVDAGPSLTHDFLGQLPPDALTADTIGRRYADLIEVARGTATFAHGLAGAQIVTPDPLPTAVGPAANAALTEEVTRVAAIVAAMADNTVSLLQIGQAAAQGIEKVQGSLDRSAAAATGAAGRLEGLTKVLIVLTVAIVILTGVLVWRALA